MLERHMLICGDSRQSKKQPRCYMFPLLLFPFIFPDITILFPLVFPFWNNDLMLTPDASFDIWCSLKPNGSHLTRRLSPAFPLLSLALPWSKKRPYIRVRVSEESKSHQLSCTVPTSSHIYIPKGYFLLDLSILFICDLSGCHIYTTVVGMSIFLWHLFCWME